MKQLENIIIIHFFMQYDKNLNTIILLYENEIHFKLVGYFQDSKMTFFI